MIKTYRELSELKTFKERFDYLRVGAQVGESTFGFDRYLNQYLYHSPEWKQVRAKVIQRDNGCDLGVDGYEIREKPIIHHINPITLEDVINRNRNVLDTNNLITTTLFTHNAIHYGIESEMVDRSPIQRQKNDTCPWRK